MSELGFKVQLKGDFDEVEARVRQALMEEGFGILTEINVRETLKKKLDVDFRPYKILGACNPPLAYRALSAVSEAGLLLPCNVTIGQGEGDTIEVSIIDPLVMFSVGDYPQLQPVAEEAQERLQRVVKALNE
ncbi:MAG: DUF302 domain-containing protein [Candidatus Promineifilaceae bacterium]|jgi:uncharacterized protein (DUF302 family)